MRNTNRQTKRANSYSIYKVNDISDQRIRDWQSINIKQFLGRNNVFLNVGETRSNKIELHGVCNLLILQK